MEAEGKMPTGMVPAGRSAIGIMLADRSRRPSNETERRQLAAAVSDRGWSLSVRFGAATALADLCRVDREEATREAWGLPRRFDVILLVAGGLDGDDLDLLVRAVRNHARRTRMHRWTGREIVPLDPGDAPRDDRGESPGRRSGGVVDAEADTSGEPRITPEPPAPPNLGGTPSSLVTIVGSRVAIRAVDQNGGRCAVSEQGRCG